jgi:hypothetical protein
MSKNSSLFVNNYCDRKKRNWIALARKRMLSIVSHGSRYIRLGSEDFVSIATLIRTSSTSNLGVAVLST